MKMTISEEEKNIVDSFVVFFLFQFFHEVDEVEYWMNTTLSRIHLTFDRSKLSGDRSDVKVIQEEMKVCVLQREREYVCVKLH